MVTANTGGITSPCRKRQTISASRLVANAEKAVGIASTIMAVTMTRLRPSTSATVPENGAISATANVLAVMIAEMPSASTPNSFDSSGRIACGE